MQLYKYFSKCWEYINENQFLFYSLIIFIFLGTILWIFNVLKRNKRSSNLYTQKKVEAKGQKENIIDTIRLAIEEQNRNPNKVVENKQKSYSGLPFDNKGIIKANTITTKIIEKPKSFDLINKIKKVTETNIETSIPILAIPDSNDNKVKVEKEEQANEKYIGYTPINVFAQSEPLYYPYVIMPRAKSIIKFPRKGRAKRKGFKEESFKLFLEKHFRNEFQVFDDRFIMVKNSNKPYEPDFTLIDEKNGINIFIDIEVDEPYEGLKDISKRKATHFQYADTNRNNAFASRGWIVIRFAEIQVHQDPNACCNFVVDVIKSINSKFICPVSLNGSRQLKPVKQWTKEEAEELSLQKYREQYLGILNFGVKSENESIDSIEETELGEIIEEKVVEIPINLSPVIPKVNLFSSKLDSINNAIISNQFLTFIYQGSPTIIKPIKATETQLTGYCFVKNLERIFIISDISKLLIKSNYYTLRIAGPSIGLDKISSVVNTAIRYQRFIRMKYTRATWNNYIVNTETGELMLDRIEAEESIRTITNVELAVNALTEEHIMVYNINNNYITAFCNKRNEKRTFRFDRIGEIEILDL